MEVERDVAPELLREISEYLQQVRGVFVCCLEQFAPNQYK